MIRISHLVKTFEGASDVHALKDVSLDINKGDIFGIIGISGAGKSTLVRCLNLLERPTSGSIEVDGVEICNLEGRALREYRHRVAMIFQGFGLLSQKTVLDNVYFPFLASKGTVSPQDRQIAENLLARVGLSSKAEVYPAQLSGGQQQRVAIARALACNPEYILCDEATSALDPASTASILELLKTINKETGVTVIIITHSMDVVREACNNVAVLSHGELVEKGSVEQVFAHPTHEITKQLLGVEDWHE
ncbi:methionine ABC transporter ATP-binding protein [Atopobium fossor]|uniref:methionine ABC transporter ATP-binding protein n=1 Tax=Atopobium fossor TaxID=39487 RepID=UPI0004072085|nr:ATP-binding cassette domain-containing protein [Atopobium fossor]